MRLMQIFPKSWLDASCAVSVVQMGHQIGICLRLIPVAITSLFWGRLLVFGLNQHLYHASVESNVLHTLTQPMFQAPRSRT